MLFLDEIKEKFTDLENIFEVGAHRGYDIKPINNCWPNSNIYAFEADPFNYKICVDNCSDFKNVNIYELAIYSENKEMVFNRFCDIENIPDSETLEGSNMQFTGCGSLFKPGIGLKEIYKIPKVTEEITVSAVSLASFCQDNNINSIDAIFMDVQGAEMNVILGCEDLIESTKAIILEWSTNYTLYEKETDFIYIKSFLESKGFKEYKRQYQLEGLNGDSCFLKQEG
tara:strand:- start:765 stop:1445 length:681 start_codon:yes stop_codon:yes gene_type:complete